MRKLAIFLIVIGVVAAVCWACGIDLPTLSWFFETSATFGYICSAIVVGIGSWMLSTGKKDFKFKPMTERRIQRFKSIKRGYWAFIILMGLVLFAALDQLVVGKRALLLKYDGKFYSPALTQKTYKNKDFGITGDTAESEVNYRKLKKIFAAEGDNWLLMPLVPYDPTKDIVSAISKDVEIKDGVVYSSLSNKKYNGQAATLFHEGDPDTVHMRYKYRNGVRVGEATGKNKKRQKVYSANYVEGKLISENYTGEGSKEDFLALESSNLRRIFYNPSPSSFKDHHLYSYCLCNRSYDRFINGLLWWNL